MLQHSVVAAAHEQNKLSSQTSSPVSFALAHLSVMPLGTYCLTSLLKAVSSPTPSSALGTRVPRWCTDKGS